MQEARKKKKKQKKQKKRALYKTVEDFTSEDDYSRYIESVLRQGMRVRALCDYESVTKGDYGHFDSSNTNSPPAKVLWDGIKSFSYWVYWHMLEIVPKSGSDDEDKGQ